MNLWFINSNQGLDSAVLIDNGCLREAQGVLYRRGGFRDLLENKSNSSQVVDATFFPTSSFIFGGQGFNC